MSFFRIAFTRVGLAHLRAQPALTHQVHPQALFTPQIRSYASKKKSKHVESTEDPKSEAFIPGSQRIAAGEVYHKAEDSMNGVAEWFRKEVSGLETRASGRVTTGLLAPVRVKLPSHDSKGVRLEEVATVGVREGTTLIVTVFEEHVRIAGSL